MQTRLVIGVLFVCTCFISGRESAMTKSEKLEFKTTGAELSSPGSLRLIRIKDQAVALASHTTPLPLGAQTEFRLLGLSSASPQWTTVAQVEELVPAEPKWDAVDREGKLEIVYQRPGGAIDALMLVQPPAEPVMLTKQFPLNSFGDPRFAKSPSGPPRWITAVMDNRLCVAFPLGKDGKYRELRGCLQGLLVFAGKDYAFLYKTDVPGPVRGVATLPGRLHCQRLDSELRSLGEPVDISGQTIFEFDAEVVNHRLVILATTPSGLSIATGSVNEVGAFHVEEYSASPEFTSPSLLNVSPAVTLIAALEPTSGKGTRMVTAELPNQTVTSAK